MKGQLDTPQHVLYNLYIKVRLAINPIKIVNIEAETTEQKSPIRYFVNSVSGENVVFMIDYSLPLGDRLIILGYFISYSQSPDGDYTVPINGKYATYKPTEPADTDHIHKTILKQAPLLVLFEQRN